ncbi:unnamed protein product, partial [Mesorhabditis belari]|uniref:Uncharacterized protein n=1 Tax=Mesorhabditis belari TaxID=2138241 RepID=A0AAF3JC54_9BILA
MSSRNQGEVPLETMVIRAQSESVETAAESSTPQEEVQQRKKYNMPAGFCQYVAEMQRNKRALNKLKVTTMDDGYRYEMQGDKKGSEEETLRLLRHNYNLLPAKRKLELELKYRSQKSSSKRLRMEATEGTFAGTSTCSVVCMSLLSTCFHYIRLAECSRLQGISRLKKTHKSHFNCLRWWKLEYSCVVPIAKSTFVVDRVKSKVFKNLSKSIW